MKSKISKEVLQKYLVKIKRYLRYYKYAYSSEIILNWTFISSMQKLMRQKDN